MSEDTTYMVATVPKNAREEIRLAISEYRGHTYADLRIFADTGLPERIPTQKGVTVAPERLDELLDGLQAVRAECERRGLIASKG